MAAIYDKALKRKDFSGVVYRDETAEEEKAEVNVVETEESKRASLPNFCLERTS